MTKVRRASRPVPMESAAAIIGYSVRELMQKMLGDDGGQGPDSSERATPVRKEVGDQELQTLRSSQVRERKGEMLEVDTVSTDQFRMAVGAEKQKHRVGANASPGTRNRM